MRDALVWSSLVHGSSQTVTRDLPGGAKLCLCEQFLTQTEGDRLLQILQQQVAWRQDSVRLFGREHRVPRLHQWFGDPGKVYRWSGLTMQPEQWTRELRALRLRVEHAAATRFNSVLANWYRDGKDSMGWHADDEPELGPQPVIASLSLGAERDFLLRYRDRDANVANVKLSLPNGSLLIMAGATQQSWQHSLPKRNKINAARINLTFRRIY